MTTRIFYLLISLLCLSQTIFSQATEKWKPYLAYYNNTAVVEAKNNVFAVADGSLFSYDKESNSVTFYSRKTGLSDNEIHFIGYNPEVEKLLIVYSNGNIDLWGDKGIENIPYLKSSALPNKTVNNFSFYKEYAYISTGFGIVIVNMKDKEITDTYKFNEAVYAVCIKDNFVFAATSSKLLKGSVNDNLLDINNWQPHSISPLSGEGIKQLYPYQGTLCFWIDGNGVFYQKNDASVTPIKYSNDIKNLTIQNDKIIFYTSNTAFIYPSLNLSQSESFSTEYINGISSFKDKDMYWVAAGSTGLLGIKKNTDKFETTTTIKNEDSPKRNLADYLTIHNNKLLVAGGGRDDDRRRSIGTIMAYENNSWFSFDETEITKQTKENFLDVISVAIDPKDENHYYASTWGEGLYEFKDNKFIHRYSEENSKLEAAIPGNKNYVRVGSLCFDKNNNLWMTNSEVKNYPVHVIEPNGTWHALRYEKLLGNNLIDQILFTSKYKWISIQRGTSSSESGIFVIDDNGTIGDVNDDKFEYYASFTDSNSGKPIEVGGYYSMAQDKNGAIWLGTNRGPIICQSPNKVENLMCNRIVRTTNEGPGYFLDGEKVTTIAIDGGNRKWLGTESSGVFLVNEDGSETLENFTMDNSPILSNNITSIAINDNTGEVFIGTDKGIISYRGDATKGSEDYSDVYAYPNPVRPEYQDRVTITGLMDNSNVKITDMNGNIIYQGKSAGGQLVWNCQARNGSRVATGVYLVLSATQDSKESVVTKIMVVK